MTITRTNNTSTTMTPATARRIIHVWESAATAPPPARRGRGIARVRVSSSSSKKDTSGRKYDHRVGGTKSQRPRGVAARRDAGLARAAANKAPMEATDELTRATGPLVMGRYRLGARLG